LQAFLIGEAIELTLGVFSNVMSFLPGSDGRNAQNVVKGSLIAAI
jgi:hypothetical protein